MILCRTLRGCVDWNMKLNCVEKAQTSVAPFAGAWIEIRLLPDVLVWLTSRTLRGCVDWNLSVITLKAIALSSHPSRVRGLKFYFNGFALTKPMSHPSRVRGLKYLWHRCLHSYSQSHPSRVRGLKWSSLRLRSIGWKVAPFAGAWIEISGPW